MESAVREPGLGSAGEGSRMRNVKPELGWVGAKIPEIHLGQYQQGEGERGKNPPPIAQRRAGPGTKARIRRGADWRYFGGQRCQRVF